MIDFILYLFVYQVKKIFTEKHFQKNKTE